MYDNMMLQFESRYYVMNEAGKLTMAKTKGSRQQITLEDIANLGPKKIILLLIAAIAIYLIGGEGLLESPSRVEQDEDSGFIMGTVTRVVDGDTAVITVDGTERRVRFLGVDTPETVHPNKPVQFYGPEASAFTKEQLTGRRVWLEYDRSPMDRYSRHLAYIWTTKPQTITDETIRRDMFNARLLLQGYAKTMNIKPNNRYAKQFAAYESEARASRLGIWTR